MPVFNFPQLEHEPFWRYLSKLNVYRAQLNCTFEKWKICEVIVLGLNVEFRGVVESICPGGLLGLLSRTQDEVWDFFENLAWDNYEFEQARQNLKYPTHAKSVFHANPYHRDSYDPSSVYAPHVFCAYCESPYNAACSCPYRDYVDATCASLAMRINELTAKAKETSLNDVIFLPSLGQKDDLSVSQSFDLAPDTNSQKDITNDVLVYTDAPATFNDSFETEEGQDPENASELDTSIITEVKHRDLDDSKDISVQEPCEKEVEPTNLELNDDILSVEYETFSCELDETASVDEGFRAEYESFSFDPRIPHKSFFVEYDSFSFDIDMGLDVATCVEYESFSFDPIQPDLLLTYHKFEFVESEAIVTEHFDLDQTPTHIELKRLVDLRPTALPSDLVYQDHISRPMTFLLATFKYDCLFPDRAQLFDQLKRTLTCAALSWWMYSLWHELFYFYCRLLTESWSCLYDKLLHALMGCDLNSSLSFDME